MRKYNKVINSIKTRTFDATSRPKPSLLSSPNNSLKASSISNNKTPENKCSKPKSGSIAKSHCLKWFPRQLPQQTSYQRRMKTLNSCTPSLYSSFEASKNVSFVKEKDFQSDSRLVEYFSSNVFTPHIKFKRFSKILKNKCNKFFESSQTERVEKHLIQLRACNRLSNKDVKQFQKASMSLQPRIGLVKRPSSGFALSKQSMVIKRRKNSFNESKGQGIRVKHIETLKFFSKDEQHTTDKQKTKTIRPSSQCICLKGANRRSIEKLKVKGEHFESIDPWQVQFQKARQFADMQIVVKI